MPSSFQTARATVHSTPQNTTCHDLKSRTQASMRLLDLVTDKEHMVQGLQLGFKRLGVASACSGARPECRMAALSKASSSASL